MKLFAAILGVVTMLLTSSIAVPLGTEAAVIDNGLAPTNVTLAKRGDDGHVIFCKNRRYADPCEAVNFRKGECMSLQGTSVATIAQSIVVPRPPPGRGSPYWYCQFWEDSNCKGKKSEGLLKNEFDLRWNFVKNSFKCRH